MYIEHFNNEFLDGITINCYYEMVILFSFLLHSCFIFWTAFKRLETLV